MTNLEEKTRKLNEQIKTFMDFTSDQLIQDSADLKVIDIKPIGEMRTVFRPLDMLMEVCLEQARVIDKIEGDLEFIKKCLIKRQ